MKIKTKINIAVTLSIVILAFLLVSYAVEENIDALKEIINQNYVLGIIIFVGAEIISIVVAPVSSIPLIPIASKTYGIFLTTVFYALGGIIGSMVAFWIGRSYGKNFVKKFISLQQAEEVSEAVNKKHLFLNLIILRIVVPADVLSYSLGIFTKVGYGMVFTTLIIGIIPGSLYFSFLGSLPIAYQLIGWIAGLAVLAIILILMFRKKSKDRI